MKLEFPNNNESFTKSELEILDFIELNKEEFLFMTIGEISEALSISDATISRFSKKVGCDDFKSLKTLVMSQIQYNGSVAVDKMTQTLKKSEDFTVTDYLKFQQQNIQRTLEYLNPEEFNNSAVEMTKVRKIWVYGKHAAKSLSILLKTRLSRLGINIEILPSGGTELIEALENITKEDMVIIFSFLKLSVEGRILLDYKRDIGFKLLLFNSRIHFPEEDLVDFNIYVYRGPANEYHSHSSTVAVIDGLVVKISEVLGQDSINRLEKIKQLKNKYKNYK